MNLKQTLNSISWPLIISLGLLALVRPIIKIFGDVFGYEVAPEATIAISAAIAVVWIAAVVLLKVKQPIITLALSGAVYAVSSIAMAVIVQLSFPNLVSEEAKLSVLLTAGLVASTLFNLVYGAFLGLVAAGIQRITRKG